MSIVCDDVGSYDVGDDNVTNPILPGMCFS